MARSPRLQLTTPLLALALAAGCSPGTAATTSSPSPATVSTTTTEAATTTAATIVATTTGVVPTTTTTVPVPPRYVVAEFFYWFDPGDPDVPPLTLTLPDGAVPDWHDPAWFEAEFADMADAGIDIAACSYWPGAPYSDGGLPNLVTALDALVERGTDPPGAAMFYETVPLWGRDLVSEDGAAYLFAGVERFFATVPERHWGRIDGRPVIWFYDNGGENAAAYSQATFDDLSTRFEARFGVRPFVVLDRSWLEGHTLEVDAIYTWGVAFLGFQPRDTVAGAGPGYDDTLVPGRDPIVIPREDGGYYRRNLYYALTSGRNILWLETWNEHHEATNINHTAEYGRQYIEITREHADLFRQGEVPPRPDPGAYAGAAAVTASPAGGQGLELLDVPGDGTWEVVETAGAAAWQTTGDAPGRYLYFDIDDGFAYFDTPVDVRVEIEFLDIGGGRLELHYDDYAPGGPDRLADHYRSQPVTSIGDSGEWRIVTVTLQAVRFANGQNGGADLRLWAGEDRDLAVRRVTLTRLGG